MRTYEFQDREGVKIVKPGDYILGVEVAKMGIAKKSGNEQIEVHARILTNENDGGLVYFYAGFGEKEQWKIDVLLKALQRAPKKGENLDISDAWLESNIRGALGWATIGQEEYPAGSGKIKNTIVRWITTRSATHIDPYKIYDAPAPADAGGTDF